MKQLRRIVAVGLLLALMCACGGTGTMPAPRLSADPEELLVRWAPRDPTYPRIPTTVKPAYPDPAPAIAAGPCSAADLRASGQVGAALGTTLMRFYIRPADRAVSCRVEGTPDIELYDGDTRLDIATAPGVVGGTYALPVLIGEQSIGALDLAWPSLWCSDPVSNDRIRFRVGDGWVDADGFGQSPGCSAEPGSGANSIRVDAFEPSSFGGESVRSVFTHVEGSLATVNDPVVGQPLTFIVTLTAYEGDATLEPCPDFRIEQQWSRDDLTSARFSLNCEGVPYIDEDGSPFLPDAVPVSFQMAPGYTVGGEKANWKLVAPGGPSLALPTERG